MAATAWCASWIATDATPGSGSPVRPVERRQVADDEDRRRPRHRQIGVDLHAPGAIERHAERGAERRRLHAGGPEDGPRFEALVADVHDAVLDVFDRGAGPHGHAEALEIPPGPIAQILRKRRQHVRPALEQQHRRRPRVDGAELVAQAWRAISTIAPASSTPVGPPPTMMKVRRPSPLVVGGGPLGPLERQQHLRADRQRVVERLEPRRVPAPVLVPEVGVRHARRQDQVVERHRADVGDAAPCRRRRRAARRPSAPGRWPAGAGSSGSARRCRRATDRPSPPDRAASGTGGGSGDR